MRFAAAIVAVLFLAACTRGGSAADGRSASSSAAKRPGVLAEVAGVGSVSVGTTKPDTIPTVKLSAEDPSAAVKETKGVLAVGRGLSVDVTGALTGRLEVRLKLPAPPTDPDAIPGVLHVLDDGTVRKEPGLYDPKTNEVVVLAASFSDRFGAWYDPRNWAEETIQAGQGVWDFVADWMTGRTDPPPCRKDDAPTWISTSTKELSSVHVCTQTNKASDGTVRAEIYLKGNRNTMQVISIPSTSKDYVWVENQGDDLRLFMPSLARVDPGTNAVLIGGDAMSLGFRQPQYDTDFEMRVYQTWPIILVNPLAGLMGGLEGNELEAMALATMSCIEGIAGFDPVRLDVVPDGFDDPKAFFGSMVKCALGLVTNPTLLISGADQVLVKMKLSAVQRNEILARARDGVDKIGPTAEKLLKVVAIAGVISQAWDSVFDNLAEGQLTGRLTGSAATKVVKVAAVSKSGAVRDGLQVTDESKAASCSTGSNAVLDGAAYRCFAGNGVYDPCWAQTAGGRSDEVLCLLRPWDTTVIRLRSDGPLPLPGSSKVDLAYPFGLELTSGERCVVYQGSRSAFGERPVDYQCDSGKFEVLRGISRNKALWKVDTVKYMKSGSRSRYENAGSKLVKTAWYGESGQPGIDWRASHPASKVKASLEAFLSAWQRGAKAEMARGSTATAREAFASDPAAWSDVQLNWSSQCALRGSGNGFCTVTLISPEGGGFSYLFKYQAVLGPQVFINEISPLGGGA
jgi:hypothetical protein